MDVIIGIPGKKFSLEVGFFDTILEIKEKIQKHQGIPVALQTLVFNGRVLEKNLKVIHFDIIQSSDIDLIINTSKNPQNQAADHHRINANPSSPVGEKLQIVVKVGSKSMGTTVCVWDTVGRLRERLSSKFPIPPHRYFIVHNVINVMEDDRSFQWHNVCEGDIVEVKSLNIEH